ncbi:MAG: ABC transporter ATP-binding protein [Elusimicrobia bacterium]|nr:ABC transporter ATP-binding protein [Elusimicrobiota bacterium]
MIEISKLTKRYGDLVAVDGIDLKVEKGEIFGLLGPNGAGKTTTVKILTGLLRPTSGVVRVAGFDVVTQQLEAKRRMGLVPDEPFVYPKLTGSEFLKFVGDLYGVSPETQRKRIPELLEMFELKDFGGELAESYSHGMRQKLVLSAALLHEPEVLLLDEPMVGLDPKGVRLVKEIFKTLSQRGCTLFMCTHILEIAERLCHRIGIMLHGRLHALGTLDDLRAKAEHDTTSGLEDVFLSLTGGSEYSALLKNL